MTLYDYLDEHAFDGNNDADMIVFPLSADRDEGFDDDDMMI